jgi:hypothetical protein
LVGPLFYLKYAGLLRVNHFDELQKIKSIQMTIAANVNVTTTNERDH